VIAALVSLALLAPAPAGAGGGTPVVTLSATPSRVLVDGAQVVLYHQLDQEALVPDRVRRVNYCCPIVPNRAGQGARILAE